MFCTTFFQHVLRPDAMIKEAYCCLTFLEVMTEYYSCLVMYVTRQHLAMLMAESLFLFCFIEQ